MSNIWDVVERTSSIIQYKSLCSFIAILTSRSKIGVMKRLGLDVVLKRFEITTFHSSIIPHSTELLSFNSHFFQLEYVKKL